MNPNFSLGARLLRWPDGTFTSSLRDPALMKTLRESAVSIIGEMQAVLAQRSGGALRDRNAPIHDPADQSLTLKP